LREASVSQALLREIRQGRKVQCKWRVSCGPEDNPQPTVRPPGAAEYAVVTAKDTSLAEHVRQATGVIVAECYQCGKCTAGCPMARFMDLSPNQVMRLVQTGDAAVLSCAAIWACAGCLTCTQRCPRKLDPAAVMDALRELAHREGKVSRRQKKILAFHEAFLKTVEKYGRMNEVPLTQRYKLASLDLFSDLSLDPAMFARGKLSLKAHRVAAKDDIARIFLACRRADRK